MRRTARPHTGVLGVRLPLEAQSPFVVVAVAIVTVLAVGVLDYATGPQFSVEALYLCPVALVTVLTSRAAGLWVTAASTACWLVADVALQHGRIDRGVVIWNLLIRSSMFCLVVVLLSALKSARAAAEASSRRNQEFLAMAAHQLRAPIAGVRASAEASLLRGSESIDENLLAHVATEAARAGALIASLLRMARLDDGPSPLSGVVDVVEVVAREVGVWRHRYPGVCFEVAAPDAPVALVANREALSDALANLLDNAARHARSTVRVSVDSAGPHVELAVSDDGPGLPRGAEERAFERFVSLDNTGGAGLGLAIARSLVESLDGSLSWGDGRFVMRFPAGGRGRRASA